ncbi:MAG: Maf family protein, partial [Gemmatimonadetes bacterium]|nr:Maf family protein [Gemmatimonadota bacterium]
MHPSLAVILASASPRRRELLTLIGIAHDVRPADIDESVFPNEAPAPHAERLARAKAHAVAAESP